MVRKQKGKNREKKSKENLWLNRLAVIIAIFALIFSGFAYFFPIIQTEPLRILVDNVKLGNTNLDCNDHSTALLSFSLFYITGERKEGSYPYYKLLKSNNTCFNGTFFRNETKNYLCWNDYSTGERVRTCQSKFEPLQLEPTDVISYLNNETNIFYEMMKKINLTDTCRVQETIQICAYSDNSCSKPEEVELVFIPCD